MSKFIILLIMDILSYIFLRYGFLGTYVTKYVFLNLTLGDYLLQIDIQLHCSLYNKVHYWWSLVVRKWIALSNWHYKQRLYLIKISYM